MNDELIARKLSELIKEGHSISNNISNSSTNFEIYEYSNIKKFQTGAENILRLRFGKKSEYYNQFLYAYKMKFPEAEHVSYHTISIIDTQTGILEAVYDALKSGLTEDLFYQREVLVFTDMLNQAFEFLNHKQYFAAAMYGRVVLEVTIKEFAKNNNVDTHQKFDQIIINLRKDEFIHKPLENSLRANYEIGSWAAHGDEKFNKLSSRQINDFLSFIRDNVLTLK